MIDGKKGNTYNIGTGIATTINQIANKKELNRSKINKYSVKDNKSHFIGLEIIDNFCCSLNIIWFLEQDKNNNYQYILYLPVN